ncbi:MAG: toll/interleukin-1 receptor domain-containing protein [Lachnospiraceae bacterium]|nr:toll/interleukin-1 receptor domain-containing protein [Lachnospiraceae bacterium]
MEELLYKVEIPTSSGTKALEVMHADMTDLSFQTDVMVCSAFVNDYVPTPRTLVGALYRNHGISVAELAQDPQIDMRQVGVWLSRPTQNARIRTIACAEMTDWYRSPVSDGFLNSFQEKTACFLDDMRANREKMDAFSQTARDFREFITSWCSPALIGESLALLCRELNELTSDLSASEEETAESTHEAFAPQDRMIELAEAICHSYVCAYTEKKNSRGRSQIGSLGWHEDRVDDAFWLSYSSLFTMLRLAYLTGVDVHTIAMPLLGSGNQKLDEHSSAMALVTECRNALQTIDGIKRIVVADVSRKKAELIADAVRELYPETMDKVVFISYNHEDSQYADYLAKQLVQRGIKVWIDSEKLKADDFGGIIVKAIRHSDLFAVLVSQNSMKSKHVLAEVKNAFNSDTDLPVILPVLLDQTPYSDDFSYYLLDTHYETADKEPREDELRMVADQILEFFQKTAEHDV